MGADGGVGGDRQSGGVVGRVSVGGGEDGDEGVWRGVH